MEFTIDRAAVIRSVVLQMIEQLEPDLRARACIHLFGVAQAAVAIAEKRGLDKELAYISGALHDYYKYMTSDTENHAQKGADAVLPILAKTELFTICEMGTISKAIAAHSDKDKIDGPYEELLKDADVMQRMLAAPTKEPQEKHRQRAEKLKAEFFGKK